jgi:hypothetical protein
LIPVGPVNPSGLVSIVDSVVVSIIVDPFQVYKIVTTPQLSFQVGRDLLCSPLSIRQFFSPLNLMPDSFVEIEEYEFHKETDDSKRDTDA